VKKLEGSEDIFGESEGILSVREVITRVAGTTTTVLITGETGTGKELVARAIHRNSLRAQKPFFAINCAAITESLLESELFGHERGAFTSADKARAGLFEAAHEGTLFLDEAKLLRVLADGELQCVGSTLTRRVDVRVLAATHRNLRDRVQQGLFREDLYYRLAVVPIHLPPLRERKDDIEGLCQVLSAKIAQEMKVANRALSKAALGKLSQYAYPGNIRELSNLIERALILGRSSELQPEDFPLQLAVTQANPTGTQFTIEQLAAQLPEQLDLRDVLTRLERSLLERALDSAGGVQAEAARRLNVSRSDLGYKFSKYSLGGKENQ
jgi:transcriptional regulator with GAF, ATPase, and Fis domain